MEIGAVFFRKKKDANVCNRKCVVPGCNSNSKRDRHLVFHKFPPKNSVKVFVQTPQGKILKDRLSLWLERCNLTTKDKFRTHDCVCSRHFTFDDYSKAGYSNTVKLNQILKKIAIPSLNLPGQICSERNKEKGIVVIPTVNTILSPIEELTTMHPTPVVIVVYPGISSTQQETSTDISFVQIPIKVEPLEEITVETEILEKHKQEHSVSTVPIIQPEIESSNKMQVGAVFTTKSNKNVIIHKQNCCVPGCNSNSAVDRNLVFHRFPMKSAVKVFVHTPEGKTLKYRLLVWLERCCLTKEEIKQNTVICSLHFTFDDYIKAGYYGKKKSHQVLKKIAIPSLNLPMEIYHEPTKKESSVIIPTVNKQPHNTESATIQPVADNFPDISSKQQLQVGNTEIRTEIEFVDIKVQPSEEIPNLVETEIHVKHKQEHYVSTFPIIQPEIESSNKMQVGAVFTTKSNNVIIQKLNCCVPGCNSNSAVDRNLVFHRFPVRTAVKVFVHTSEGKTLKDRLLVWLERCYLTKEEIKHNTVICSLHFTFDDYSKSGYYGEKKSQQVLKKIAIPSLNLPMEIYHERTKKEYSVIIPTIPTENKQPHNTESATIQPVADNFPDISSKQQLQVGNTEIRTEIEFVDIKVQPSEDLTNLVETEYEKHELQLHSTFNIKEEVQDEDHNDTSSDLQKHKLMDFCKRQNEEETEIPKQGYKNVTSHILRREDSKKTCEYINRKKVIWQYLNCKICLQSYRYESAFKRHIQNCRPVIIKSVIKEKEMQIFMCDICNKIIKSKNQLVKHLELHDTTSYIYCDLCPNKKFKTKEYFRNHFKNVHSYLAGYSKKAFKCGLCKHKKYFKSKMYLCNHINIVHRKEGTFFVCDQCGKSFKSNCGLRRHIKTHAKAQYYKCQLCKNTFKREGNLARHITKEHPEHIV